MQTALITGASGGIGAAFAQGLAARQMNLILVARSEDKLNQLAATLRSEFNVKVQVIAQDLAEIGAPLHVFEVVKQQGQVVDLLINNAGIGDYGPFGERSLEQQSQIVRLNVLALVETTHLFLPGMQQRKSGGIINVSSISAFQPIPYLCVYSSSKAFILHFSQALWAENKAKGVKVLAVCPGPTKTDFFKAAEMDSNVHLMERQSYESPEKIVQDALTALEAGRSNIVTGGLRNQVLVNANRMAPREILVSALEKEFRPES